PALSVLFRDGWAFVAQGEAGRRLPELAAVGESAALSTEVEYQDARKRLPQEWQVLVRLPPTSSYARPGDMHGALVSLSPGAEGLSVFAVQPWPNTQASVELLKPQGPAPDLFGLAAPD